MASHTISPPAHAAHKKERKLDETLEQTFPASDPPAANRFTGAEVKAEPASRSAEDVPETHDQATSNELDEALEESFPASDPPSLTRKHGRDDADPA